MMVTAARPVSSKFGPSLLLSIDNVCDAYLNGIWVNRFMDAFYSSGFVYFQFFGTKKKADDQYYHHIELI